MTKILLIRHAESTANVGDVAFGNLNAPLTQNGLLNQIPQTKKELIEKYSINPDQYTNPVAVSLYKRTLQTAEALGFKNTETIEIIGESEIYNSGELASVDVVKKHVDEHGWLPNQELSRAQQIIQNIRSGIMNYEIIISHGMVIASILSELNRQGLYTTNPDARRGYVPLQSQIIAVEI